MSGIEVIALVAGIVSACNGGVTVFRNWRNDRKEKREKGDNKRLEDLVNGSGKERCREGLGNIGQARSERSETFLRLARDPSEAARHGSDNHADEQLFDPAESPATKWIGPGEQQSLHDMVTALLDLFDRRQQRIEALEAENKELKNGHNEHFQMLETEYAREVQEARAARASAEQKMQEAQSELESLRLETTGLHQRLQNQAEMLEGKDRKLRNRHDFDPVLPVKLQREFAKPLVMSDPTMRMSIPDDFDPVPPVKLHHDFAKPVAISDSTMRMSLSDDFDRMSSLTPGHCDAHLTLGSSRRFLSNATSFPLYTRVKYSGTLETPQ